MKMKALQEHIETLQQKKNELKKKKKKKKKKKHRGKGFKEFAITHYINLKHFLLIKFYSHAWHECVHSIIQIFLLNINVDSL